MLDKSVAYTMKKIRCKGKYVLSSARR